MSALHPLLGYFTSPEQTVPEHDPGLVDTPCLVCTRPLHEAPVCTISLMLNSPRIISAFFRAHKACWDGCSDAEQAAYESSFVDQDLLAHSRKVFP